MVLFSHVPIHDKRFDLFSKMRSASLLKPPDQHDGAMALRQHQWWILYLAATNRPAPITVTKTDLLCTNNSHQNRPLLHQY